MKPTTLHFRSDTGKQLFWSLSTECSAADSPLEAIMSTINKRILFMVRLAFNRFDFPIFVIKFN